MPAKNLMDLTGRVAVVVGATSGIGRELAIGLAEAGADVVPTGRRQQLVDEVATTVEAAGVRALRHACDIGDAGSLYSLRDAAMNEFGHVDILINAAGRIFRKPTHVVPEEDWNALFDTNLTGMMRACECFRQVLGANRRGRVINIASLNSYVALLEVAPYAASKSAALALTRSLAVEWAKEGINVNAIAPGVFRTELNAALLDGTERGRELRARTPMGRFGNAKELVGAAILLASDAASFITGQCIAVDGGFLASGAID